MVKKGNKYQLASEKDLWDQKDRQDQPESPTEGAVAPLSYTPLTNRPGKREINEKRCRRHRHFQLSEIGMEKSERT